MFDWERIWRGNGIQYAVLAIIGFALYGRPPKVGASQLDVVAYDDGHRTRILIATVILGFAVLGLLWFGAALSSLLRDSGMGGWGEAATASSAVLGGIVLLLVTLRAALAYSIAGAGSNEITSALNDLSSASLVIEAFPAAMFVMASAFGLWRAGIISKGFFAVGVVAVMLVLLGGTTWARTGFWATDGAYTQVLWPTLMAVWIGVISGFLMRRPTTVTTPGAAASAETNWRPPGRPLPS
jgi:hypothetical protein